MNQLTDYAHHLHRAAGCRRMAEKSSCREAGALHVQLAILHEIAASEIKGIIPDANLS